MTHGRLRNSADARNSVCLHVNDSHGVGVHQHRDNGHVPSRVSGPRKITLMSSSASEWIAAYADLLGVDAPTEAEFEEILLLAGTAAHASERTAAPVACWMAARAGLSAQAANELALKAPSSDSNSG